MIQEQISNILLRIVPDKEIHRDIDRLVTVGSESELAQEFINEIENTFHIEIENDFINHQFFTDFGYIEKIIKKSMNGSETI
jgi:hypothetical protein